MTKDPRFRVLVLGPTVLDLVTTVLHLVTRVLDLGTKGPSFRY